MSILERHSIKNGMSTGIKSNYAVGGDSGVWADYLKNISVSNDGAERIEFHLCDTVEYAALIRLQFGLETADKQGYLIVVRLDGIDLYSQTQIGLIYAAFQLKAQMKEGKIDCGAIYNYPDVEFRACKTFLPARENIAYFYELVDFCLAYGVNSIVLEVGGAMEYKTHPEINAGWVEYCRKFMDYPGQSVEYQFSTDVPKNSIHWENGGGGVLTQDEVRRIVKYCKDRGMEVIPEVPSLSHSDYLLYRHRELAESPSDPTPDAYCPKNPGSFQLVSELLEEVIDVFQPSVVHIGHDELYTIGLCERCAGEDPAALFADDVNRYHRFLKSKGIRTMIWGDKLLNARGKSGHEWGGAEQRLKREDGTLKCRVPAVHRCIDLIDRDVLIMHWYWFVNREFDTALSGRFYTVYGNFKGVEMIDYEGRRQNGIHGYCTANWSECKKIILQRNGIFFHLAYNAMMYWSGNYDGKRLRENIERVTDDIFGYANRDVLKGNYLEITHNTDCFFPHEEFVDGYFVDEKKDSLGSYLVRFSDGTEMRIPVQYGENIGYGGIDFSSEVSPIYDSYRFHQQLFETVPTCRLHRVGNRMYYQFVCPVKSGGKLVSCRFEPKNSEITVNLLSVKFIEKERVRALC